MKRNCVAAQVLCAALFVISPALGEDGIAGEVGSLERACAGLSRSISSAVRGTNLGISPSGAWLLGAFLPKGKQVGIAQSVKKGSRYAYCGATSGEGAVLSVQVRGADKKLLSEARGAAPYVQFTPEADCDIAVWVRMVDTPAPAPAMLAMLREGGTALNTEALGPLFTRLGERITTVGGGKGSMLHAKQDWSILGTSMSTTRNTILNGLHYGGETIQAVAVAQPGARNLDLALLGEDKKVLQADTRKDATPHVTAAAEPEAGYSLRLDLVDGPPQTLVLAAVISGGEATSGLAGGDAGPKPTGSPAGVGGNLAVATVVPDHLFGLADGATVAYGIWHLRRVADSVCLTPPDAKFTLEIWEGSNGYVVMRENGETYIWHAVGARVSGKFDIPPDAVAAAKPTARVAEKAGTCRKWVYRFSDQGIELENTDIKVTYIILKDKAEMIHIKNGERTVLPVKPPVD